MLRSAHSFAPPLHSNYNLTHREFIIIIIIIIFISFI